MDHFNLEIQVLQFWGIFLYCLFDKILFAFCSLIKLLFSKCWHFLNCCYLLSFKSFFSSLFHECNIKFSEDISFFFKFSFASNILFISFEMLIHFFFLFICDLSFMLETFLKWLMILCYYMSEEGTKKMIGSLKEGRKILANCGHSSGNWSRIWQLWREPQMSVFVGLLSLSSQFP